MLLNIIISVFIALVIALISYRVKFLTISGSVATFILASLIFSLGGLKWSVPIMTFFILSSILSKIRKRVNENVETYFEKSGVRDHWQVIANGGIGGILVLINYFYSNELFYLMYVAAMAAVCADTWATEIGTLYKTKTYNILNLNPIEQGISGGISLIGTLGGCLGAFVIALSATVWINISLTSYFIFIVFAGLTGSLFDSLLGATLQAQFECTRCGKITERIVHCNENTTHKSGYNWMNNDLVNLLAGIFGSISIILLKNIFI
jgi:uncharacterized protein (TIGR00297 family)